MNWHPLALSLQVTAVATLGIVVIELLIAWILARVRFPGKLFLETLILLPLVMPPSVLGYYLLLLLGRDSFVQTVLGIEILFTWQAAAIASMLVGIPLMVQSARAGLEEVDPEIEDAARVDGASGFQIIQFITLPVARRSILAGLVLGSARAMGKFGATLLIAGNIPGRTQTFPLAIYEAVQTRQYDDANMMVFVLTLVAFVYLWGIYRLCVPQKIRCNAPFYRTKHLPTGSLIQIADTAFVSRKLPQSTPAPPHAPPSYRTR